MRFLLAAGVGVTAFMLMQLWQKKDGNKLSRNIAMLLQVLWLLRFSLLYIKVQSPDLEVAWLIIYDQTLLFLDGPLIWFYTRSLIEKYPIEGKQWLHFLPFGLMLAYTTYVLINNPEGIVATFQNTYRAFEEGWSNASRISLIIIGPIILFNLTYLFLSIRVARAYNLALEDEYSTTERLTADWIINFLQLWFLLFVIPLLLYFINYSWPFFDMMILGGAILVSIVLLSVIFDLGLVKQVYVTFPVKSKSTGKPISHLSNNELNVQLENLMQTLANEKQYLEEDLTLSQLAGAINIKPNELTELIKFSTYENFYDLVNSFRIEEVKRQLINSNEQVMQIAYQSGFRSKSTFNKIFKDKTGQTPKAFRNLQK